MLLDANNSQRAIKNAQISVEIVIEKSYRGKVLINMGPAAGFPSDMVHERLIVIYLAHQKLTIFTKKWKHVPDVALSCRILYF